MEIQFYHLLTTPLEVALPKLLPKALAAGLKTVIQCRDVAQQEMLDEKLWTQDPDSFIPHGKAGDENENLQPILLSLSAQRPNDACLLLILNRSLASPEILEGYTRMIDMFDGTSETEISAARNRWKEYKSAGHTLTYYKQQPNGAWKQEG